MKPFAILPQIAIIICFLYQLKIIKCENNRKWMEIGHELYRIEPEGKYTWKKAAAECQKEHSQLINPKGDYDYAKLKDAIKHNFKHYSSFWTNTQVKWTNVFHQIGLGKNQNNPQRCNKFDNSSMFKYLPDDCDKQLGFICQKPLLKGFSSFNNKNTVYLVQPDHEFTCTQAYDECEKHQMYLLVLTEYTKNNLLKDYIFINYGSSVSFWFGYNNETHYNCATPRRGQHIDSNSKLGFICQRNYFKGQSLSMRHFVLIIFVTSAAILAIVVYVFARCLCHKKVEKFYMPEAYFSEEIKESLH